MEEETRGSDRPDDHAGGSGRPVARHDRIGSPKPR